MPTLYINCAYDTMCLFVLIVKLGNNCISTYIFRLISQGILDNDSIQSYENVSSHL